MLVSPTKKNKVNLSDYDYRRDIENRIVMSSFSIEEVDVLQEILHSSIKLPIHDLMAQMHMREEKLLPILDKLQSVSLLEYDATMIIVNKEMRKYYELQTDKFDDDFKPDIPFLRALLNKVPIHVLPNWYAIPRMSNDIIASITEKYLATPAIYRRYLQELHFEDPVLSSIMNDVFSAPDFKIRSRTLREKYSLSREAFEEAMLHLEFNFVCYISYNRVDGMWKEVVTPFYEWWEYLSFEKESIPTPLTNKKSIKKDHPKEFGYIEEMTHLLESVDEKPVEWSEDLDVVIKKIFPRKKAQDYRAYLEKLLKLQMVDVEKGHLQLTESAKDWLKLSIPERAMAWLRHPLNTLDMSGLNPKWDSDRNARLTEKALKRMGSCDWMLFDDFIDSLLEPIADAEPVSLKRVKPGKWRYVRPSFTKESRELIRRMVFNKFFEVGIVTTGTYEDQPCFTLTPFGKTVINS